MPLKTGKSSMVDNIKRDFVSKELLSSTEKVNFHVLLIDDEPGIQEMLTYYMRREGIKVVGVSGGKEALELMKQQFFNVIITDLELPLFSGLEFIEKVSSDFPNLKNKTKIILISGYEKTFVKEKLKKIPSESIYRILLKPFSPSELISELKNLF